jgi:trans-2,3-dihydro-3-hydroxyanthranilate isomerase
MGQYRYRLVNVFAEAVLEGNPLCVFEDARGLDDATMQALALQFNLSETTFVLPSTRATACVRIFTPQFEMPFAGHPTLGTAHVIRALHAGDDEITLEMSVGLVPVRAHGDRWTLSAQPPKTRRTGIDPLSVARFLKLDASDIASDPLWVDTGSEQLIVPLASVDAVRRTEPDSSTMNAWPKNNRGRSMFYVWAWRDPANIEVRFFFTKYTSVIEDPGTGSACANLGGWMIATGRPLPIDVSVYQGTAVARPCRLGLAIDSKQTISVSGRVLELGDGSIRLP